MKNKAMVMISLFVLVSTLLTGCASPADAGAKEPVNIAFVVGIADDETVLNDGIAELSALPALPGTDYAFISAVGVPVTIGEPGTIPDLSDRGYTNDMMERVYAGIRADLAERLASYMPATGEIDMAAAITLAVRTLNAHAVEGRPNILVLYCSGKSTTGLINMVETPVFKLDAETSVPAVAAKMNLDMSNIDEVIWYCCGDCGSKQPALSSNEKDQMKSFYESLFYTLGAQQVTFKKDLPSKECYDFSATPVSCMAVEGTVNGLRELVGLETEIFEEIDEAEAPAEEFIETPIVIREDQVRYRPDSDHFLDPDAATEAIQPMVDFLLAYPSIDLVVYSTCAGDADCEWLSRARSESVKKVLLAGGVDESRITVVSVSVRNDPYYQFGLGTGSAASVNRKTVMVFSTSAFGQELLGEE